MCMCVCVCAKFPRDCNLGDDNDGGVFLPFASSSGTSIEGTTVYSCTSSVCVFFSIISIYPEFLPRGQSEAYRKKTIVMGGNESVR